MVEFRPPPPDRRVDPIFVDLPVGATLVRIFDPTRRNATALTFRNHGPLKRFDHHPGCGEDGDPCCDPERCVYYAAWSGHLPEALSCCVVEYFGDTGVVELANKLVATPTLIRSIRLLDLRDNGAMRAGTVAVVAKCEHRLSQPWSRYFYESTDDFGMVEGLIYRNAHNDQPAVLLYERARDALACPDSAIIELSHNGLRYELNRIILANNLILARQS